MDTALAAGQIHGRGKRRFQDLLKEARLGAPQAQYDVGLMYANGVGGVPKNVAQAVYWMEQSADRGCASAQYLLGTRYSSGNGVEKSAIHALFWLQKAAAQGHPKAHHKIGQLFQHQSVALAQSYALQAWEMGVTDAALVASQAVSDPAQSYSILERAAQSGSVRAHFELARQDEAISPAGVPTRESLAHLRAAARKNYPPAVMALHELDQLGRGRRQGSTSSEAGADMRVVLQDAAAALDPDDIEARYCLGQMLELGIKIAVNRPQAIAYYRSAAAAGHPLAQWALVRMGANGAAGAQDILMQSARAGCAPAQWHCGAALKDRATDGAEHAMALAWMLQALANGHVQQWESLADFFHSDRAQTIVRHAMMVAAKGGDVSAQYEFAMCLSGKGSEPGLIDLVAAQTWLESAAVQGHVLAQRELAQLLLAQSPSNAKQALHWYQLAAQAGDAVAQWNVCKLFLVRSTGRNGAESLRQAFLWCKAAADQGFVPAQATLGGMYVRIGKESEAQQYLMLAARAGDAEAQYNLSVLLGGAGVPDCEPAALEWLLESANQGVVPAQMRLAKMYFEGHGVPQDAVEAMKWLMVVQASQPELAEEPAALVRSGLTSEQLGESVRRANHWVASSAKAVGQKTQGEG